MASMLDKMDPEVAKKALEQFPEFSKTTKEMIKEYLDSGMKNNQDSVIAYYDICKSIIDSLQKELEKENLSFEERKYIIEQMKELADKIDKKDTENKMFIADMTI